MIWQCGDLVVDFPGEEGERLKAVLEEHKRNPPRKHPHKGSPVRRLCDDLASVDGGCREESEE